MNTNEQITKHVSRFFTAFCLSNAILEDYAKVVAKLEGTTEKEVTERITKRSNEIREKLLKEQGND